MKKRLKLIPFRDLLTNLRKRPGIYQHPEYLEALLRDCYAAAFELMQDGFGYCKMSRSSFPRRTFGALIGWVELVEARADLLNWIESLPKRDMLRLHDEEVISK